MFALATFSSYFSFLRAWKLGELINLLLSPPLSRAARMQAVLKPVEANYESMKRVTRWEVARVGEKIMQLDLSRLSRALVRIGEVKGITTSYLFILCP
jgi:hypothetical protein